MPLRPRSRLNMAALLNDHGVEFRHGNGDWLQLHCPVCYRGDGKMGLGWSGTVFSCFRCGRLDLFETLSLVLRQPPLECRRIAERYRGDVDPVLGIDRQSSGDLGGVLTMKLPIGSGSLDKPHQEYLKTRVFDLETARCWGLLGTGAAGPIPWRIIAPIKENEKIVCWQARAISPTARERYKTCPDTEAIIPAKCCLYGGDEARGRRSVVVTEGITKVWRLGPGAVATFGATVTNMQAMKIRKHWKRAYILFDEDEAGSAGAEKLAHMLAPLGIQVQLVRVGIADVADLSVENAVQLMGDLK